MFIYILVEYIIFTYLLRLLLYGLEIAIVLVSNQLSGVVVVVMG